MNPVHLAQHLVNRFGHVPGGVTPLKLQKLLYYVKAWSLVDGDDLVEGDFERWPHGPVQPEVYSHFKARGYTRQPLQPRGLGPEQQPQGAAHAFVDFVGHSYARFPAVALSKMTHDEDPWRTTPPGHTIHADLIRAFYAAQPFAANLPFDPTGKPYVPVQSHMDRAFTFDMNPADARRASGYASYRAYLERLERAGYLAEDDTLSGLLA